MGIVSRPLGFSLLAIDFDRPKFSILQKVTLDRRSVVSCPQLPIPTDQFRSLSSSWLKESPKVLQEVTPTMESCSPSTSKCLRSIKEVRSSLLNFTARQTKPSTRYPRSSSAAGKVAPKLSLPPRFSVLPSERVCQSTRASVSLGGTRLLGS
jgi:hypothetical protein